MNLKQHLINNSIAIEDFARNIDVTAQSIRNYLAGRRKPNSAVMTKIVSETNGAVTPNDFYLTSEIPLKNEDR